jgi:hypothetical protein
VATAVKTGAAFYVFGLVRLPTLAFVGLVTFNRVLQSGIADLGYANRIARLRDYYLDCRPELACCLTNPAEPCPPLASDPPVAAIRDRSRDGRRDDCGTGRLGRRAVRGRSFRPHAGCGGRCRRGCCWRDADGADAVSEFGLDPGDLRLQYFPGADTEPQLNRPIRCSKAPQLLRPADIDQQGRPESPRLRARTGRAVPDSSPVRRSHPAGLAAEQCNEMVARASRAS